MNATQVAEILALPVQERIQLVELIWDSVAALPEPPNLSPELRAELVARLLADEAQADEPGLTWDEVKQHLRSGTWRTV